MLFIVYFCDPFPRGGAVDTVQRILVHNLLISEEAIVQDIAPLPYHDRNLHRLPRNTCGNVGAAIHDSTAWKV